MLVLIYISISFLWVAGVGYLAWHWSEIKVPEEGKEFQQLKGIWVSVVVVVRNEEENIQKLLLDLARQSFAPACFEVLVVDDHSEDSTCRQVQEMAAVVPCRLRLLPLRGGEGKKAGLQLGVEEAVGSVIVVTDGDCRVPASWLEKMSGMFSTGKAVFVAGPVTFSEEKSLFEKMQTIEFASLVGTGAAMLQAGEAGMCNAANMAFTREVFMEVLEGRTDSHIPSGDDEFLLQSVYQRFPEGINFIKHKGAVVSTGARRSWNDFLQQRRRWAGKWRLHKNPSVLFTAMAVFFLQLGWLAASVLMLLNGFLIYFFAGVLLKFGAEFLFLRSVLRSFGKTILVLPFLLLQLLYPMYVLFFGLAANFGSFTWKGRKYNYSKL